MVKENLKTESKEHIKSLKETNTNLPENFDSRLEWPLCWSVHYVPNQGGCGSCWVMFWVSTPFIQYDLYFIGHVSHSCYVRQNLYSFKWNSSATNFRSRSHKLLFVMWRVSLMW